MMSGAPCPVELMKRVLDEMHCRELVIAYGQTETSPVVTMSDAEDTIEVRVKTVGRAMPQTEIAIRSLDTQEMLPYGQQGEVCVRGYALMKGYDGDPDGTAEVIQPDGWLHTGDLGVMREDGCIHITGRSRDVIIRGGENIYPREVEEFLYTHPKIGEVQAVGIPNERLGEIVVAWVRLVPGVQATEEEIKASARARSRTTKFLSTSALSPSSRLRFQARSRNTRCASSRLKPAACRPSQRRRPHSGLWSSRHRSSCHSERTGPQTFLSLGMVSEESAVASSLFLCGL